MARLACLILGLWSSARLAAEAPADFTVPAVVGGPEFKLSAAQGDYVVLHFLLKTECPVCLRHTRSYLQRSAELPGVRQVFLKPDTTEEIQAWARDLGKDLPLYRDVDASLAQAYGIPDGYAFHGQTVHFPALVLLDPAGREVFRYVGKSNRERYSFDDLKLKVAELRSTKAAQK